MQPRRIDELIRVYRDGLLRDTLPFWTGHAVDRVHGGYFHSLDRDGSVIDTDKQVWGQGRFAWVLATMYATVEPRPEWLELARHGLDFLRAHAFDRDGRMFFLLTREGRPLRKRRYFFSEIFATQALAAYARAAGDARAGLEALDLFKGILRLVETPGALEPKVNPETRPQKSLTVPMVLLSTAQVLREAVTDPLCGRTIDRAILEIERDFVKDDLGCVLETVGPGGEFLDHFDGRLLNPGHAIEAGWFILAEARRRGRDARLIRLGCKILDWSWRAGWDDVHGGLFYFRDARGLPSPEYWHDMKFWWPHNEAIVATLLAHHLTGEEKYARWHREVHDWAYAHFPDPEFGEWFGYLHRDGTVSSRLKGNHWKGPFHLSRMQWHCWKLLEEMKAAEAISCARSTSP